MQIVERFGLIDIPHIYKPIETKGVAMIGKERLRSFIK